MIRLQTRHLVLLMINLQYYFFLQRITSKKRENDVRTKYNGAVLSPSLESTQCTTFRISRTVQLLLTFLYFYWALLEYEDWIILSLTLLRWMRRCFANVVSCGVMLFLYKRRQLHYHQYNLKNEITDLIECCLLLLENVLAFIVGFHRFMKTMS